MEKINDSIIFKNGKIDPSFIGEAIAELSKNATIGAHSIFLGQVRNDEIDGKAVSAIDYTAYEELAQLQMDQISLSILEQYPIIQLHVYHSLGIVNAGEICLFVLVTSKHRKPATEACSKVVERIKAELPIWGKEILIDETYQWKENS